MPALPLIAISLLTTAQAGGSSSDACASLIPPALNMQLTTALPDYRLPSSEDAGAERLKAITAQGDWPCPFIVLSDFDGDGRLDRAMLLPARNGDGARLLVALNAPDQWLFSLSEDWPMAMNLSELRPLESGLYQRNDAIAQPAAQLDQLQSLQADFSSFRAGNTGAEYNLYALVGGHWQKLVMPAEP